MFGLIAFVICSSNDQVINTEFVCSYTIFSKSSNTRWIYQPRVLNPSIHFLTVVMIYAYFVTMCNSDVESSGNLQMLPYSRSTSGTSQGSTCLHFTVSPFNSDAYISLSLGLFRKRHLTIDPRRCPTCSQKPII